MPKCFVNFVVLKPTVKCQILYQCQGKSFVDLVMVSSHSPQQQSAAPRVLNSLTEHNLINLQPVHIIKISFPGTDFSIILQLILAMS